MRRTPKLGGGSLGGVALLLFAMGLWSGSFRVTAEAAGHTSAIMISALRTAPAGLLLLAAVPLFKGASSTE